MIIRLATFGHVQCLLGKQEIVDLPRQRIRYALLIYLAIEGQATRQSLYNLFWSERTDSKARGTLKQSLYELRRQLGADWIEPNPDPVVISSHVHTDVADFEAAVASGDALAALAHYRGDFLSDFATPDSKEFEFWLDRKRAHYAREHRALRRKCIADLRASGQTADALLVAREWAELDSQEDEAEHTLIELLASTGQRAEALRQYESYERHLDADRLRPLPQTVALIAALRAAVPDTPVPAHLQATIELGRPARPPIEAFARRNHYRRGRRIALSGLGLAALLSIGIAVSLHSRTPGAPPILALGSINGQVGPDSLNSGALVGDMIATNLARVAGLQVVSTARLQEVLGELRGTSTSIVQAAREAGASEILEGSLLVLGERRLRLELRRASLENDAERATYTIDGIDLFDLAEQATRKVTDDFGIAADSLRIAEVTTHSLRAYRLYVKGLIGLSKGEAAETAKLFDAAVEEDSLFALAALYAWHSRNLAGLPTTLEQLERLDSLSVRAPDRERLLFRSAVLKALGDPAYLALAETLVVRYPIEPESHNRLASARIDQGDFLGALPHLRNVIELDSLSARHAGVRCRVCNALAGLITAYQLADSACAAERVAQEWIRYQPGTPEPWRSLGLALAIEGRFEEADGAFRSTAAASDLDPTENRFLSLIAQHYAADFASVDRSLAELSRSTTPAVRKAALWYLTISLRSQGRLREALATVRRLETMTEPDHRDGVVALRGQVLFELGRYGEAEHAFDSLAVFTSHHAVRGSLARHKSWMLTHLATIQAAEGDTAVLAALLEPLRDWGARSAYGRDARLNHYANGLLLEARGQINEAATEFRRALYSPTQGYTRTNYELGRILLALDRPREAVEVLAPALRGGIDAGNLYITRTELHELLGQAYESAGQPDSAAVHYMWVLKAWRNADPQFQQRREAVRARLAKVQG